jgi:pentatricopeptide repeat protein
MNIARRNLARRNLYMSTEDKLKETVCFIEATDFERHEIWRKLHETHDYEHDSIGSSIVVGCIKGDPTLSVTVQLLFSYLKGYRICMYTPTSRYVDHTLIEEFFEKNYPVTYQNGNRRAMCDAGNYRHMLDVVKYLEEQNIVPDATTA